MAVRRILCSFLASSRQHSNKSKCPQQCLFMIQQRLSSFPAASSSCGLLPPGDARLANRGNGLGFRGVRDLGRVLDDSLRWSDNDGGFGMQSVRICRQAVRALSLATAEKNVAAAAAASSCNSGLVHVGGFKLNEVALQRAEHIGYTVVGRLDFGSPVNVEPQEAFAVVQVGSHQFKVTPGDSIYTEKLKFADINDKLRLNKVLLLGTKHQSVIGRPVVLSSAVFAVVEEHALDAKVIIFKKKRRKNYRRTRGHRQELTRLRITNIEGLEVNSHTEAEAKASS
ncbi:hypothetical protein O6H91_02G083200 [Diphasiastrum complanatum]|uniref:Uncharacterized protein n=1 Tax=Diphasiastrum complanatum TaxID=34168 RepID=A0ACC2EHT0_DIPCM|nr:hypothetical protein O6H91_02G083200 [Diphasiastrum complanatum]